MQSKYLILDTQRRREGESERERERETERDKERATESKRGSAILLTGQNRSPARNPRTKLIQPQQKLPGYLRQDLVSLISCHSSVGQHILQVSCLSGGGGGRGDDVLLLLPVSHHADDPRLLLPIPAWSRQLDRQSLGRQGTLGIGGLKCWKSDDK